MKKNDSTRNIDDELRHFDPKKVRLLGYSIKPCAHKPEICLPYATDTEMEYVQVLKDVMEPKRRKYRIEAETMMINKEFWLFKETAYEFENCGE